MMIKSLFVATLALGLALSASAEPSKTAAPANLGPLEHTVVVNAKVDQVWDAFTTKKGLEAWMVPVTEVDLRVGGYWKTTYSKDGKIGDSSTIEQSIMCLDHHRMMAFRTVKWPEKFPFPNAIAKMYNILYFEPLEGGKTRVTLREWGYTADEESQKMRGFFDQGNAYTMESLKKHFDKQAQ